MFDHYIAAATSEQSLDRLAGLLVGAELPAGFFFDQDRRWNVVELLSGFDHSGARALLAEERERDPSDEGRRRALSAKAAQPDAEQQRHLMGLLLDPDSGLSVADARAHAGGLFPEHQHDQQLEIAPTVLDSLQAVSDSHDPSYFRAITGGLLGTICDDGHLELLEQAINGSETLRPSLKKALLNLRFEVKRCLAVGEVLAGPA